MKYEVKVAGYSIGITKWFKDAELWFKKTNNNLDAQLVEVTDVGVKKVLKSRKGNGFSLGSLSGLQPAAGNRKSV